MRAAARLLLACLALSACTEAPRDAGPADSADPADSSAASARPVSAAPVDASRIVAVGGPVTETVYALGMGDRVVGSDASSLFPAAVLALPRLDYFRQTSAEGVLSLAPSLVLAVEGTGPPGVVEQIRAAGVRVEVLPEVVDAATAAARVRRVGRILGREARADSLVGVMTRQIAAAQAERPAVAPRALFVYARGAGVVLAAGTGGAPAAVLRLAGAENAVTAFDGYRPLTAEAVAAAQPDVIVVPAASLESLGGIDGLLRQPGLAETPAGKARRVVAVDDALLLGFGPRVGDGVRDLVRGLTRAQADA